MTYNSNIPSLMSAISTLKQRVYGYGYNQYGGSSQQPFMTVFQDIYAFLNYLEQYLASEQSQQSNTQNHIDSLLNPLRNQLYAEIKELQEMKGELAQVIHNEKERQKMRERIDKLDHK